MEQLQQNRLKRDIKATCDIKSMPTAEIEHEDSVLIMDVKTFYVFFIKI